MLDPFDREPALPVADRSLTPARVAATAAAGLPAVGLGLLCLSEGFSDAGTLSLGRVSRLMLGAALLVLFGEVSLSIHRAHALGWVLLFGVLGFGGAFTAVILAEVGGPGALGVVVLLVAGLALAAALTRARSGQH